MDAQSLDRTRTILVVDDNALMRKLLVRCLEEGGHRVVETDDPRGVLDLMRALKPDLVIMDVVMPGLSGVELVRMIRADRALARTLVVAVTNLSTPTDMLRFSNAGFDAHVPKPIQPRDFLATVNGYLDGEGERL
ncbi:response regulator [Azospirillum brasilense]|uniref:Response regulator n=1 Tax=Azospirillum brasilense TaxID=192 RepID=A0A235HHI1_AZOBR|nr:response regulator [Azospirillum brasilense]OYD85259.1 response regulator [Azospirillum brasilense]